MLAAYLEFSGLVTFTDYVVGTDEAAIELAGLVDETYTPDASVATHLKEFEDGIADKTKIASIIRREMEYFGFEVYEQKFTFSHKLLQGLGNVSSSNLYAIMRSRSGSRTEALVVIAPLRASGESERTISGSYTYIISLAKQLSSQLYWAKDIIFLFPDMEYIGLIAWLDAYYGVNTSPVVHGSKLDGRSGSLQAGICLEFPTLNIARLDVSYQGMNGELPNLDLINTVTRLAKKHAIPLSFHGQPQGFTHSSRLPQVKQLISSIWLQGSGSPSGLHGPLISFQIPCLTLRGIPPSSSASQQPNVRYVKQVGSLIEGFLRCLNNLQERMHQSFYYYLLPDLWHYISIGVYIPFILIALAAMLVQVVRIYVEITVTEANQTIASEPSVQAKNDCESSSLQEYDEATKEENFDYQMKHRIKEGTKYLHCKNGDNNKSSESDRIVHQFVVNIFSTVTSFALCLACGAAVHQLPDLIYSRLVPQSIEHPDSVWRTAELSVSAAFTGTIFGLALILPLQALVTKSRWFGFDQKWHLSCPTAALLWCGFLGWLSPMNVSASFLLLIVIEPVILFVVSRRRPTKCHRIVAALFLLAVSPPVLVAAAAQLHSYITQYPPAASTKVTSVVDLFESCGKLLCQAHMEALVLGSWSWSLLSLCVVPLWLFSWTALFSNE
ncbi:hypothetical protein Aperf_G00000118515 [Anoplocephala perfoliata]